MKNILSPEKAVKAINSAGLVSVHHFKQTGERVGSYGGLNIIQAIKWITYCLSLNYKVVVTSHDRNIDIPLNETLGSQTDVNAYSKYLNYAIQLGEHPTDCKDYDLKQQLK